MKWLEPLEGLPPDSRAWLVMDDNVIYLYRKEDGSPDRFYKVTGALLWLENRGIKICRKTIYRWIESGLFLPPPIWINGRILLRESALERILDSAVVMSG